MAHKKVSDDPAVPTKQGPLMSRFQRALPVVRKYGLQAKAKQVLAVKLVTYF